MKTGLVVLLSFATVLAYGQFKEMPAQKIPQGAAYELGFSPGGTALFVVLHAIQSARTILLVSCEELTSLPIAEALIAAAVRGVKVSVVADNDASNDRYSLVSSLQDRGIPVRRNSRYSIEHNSFLVIDDDSIETGSYTYATVADQHDAENALYLMHVPNIAVHYAEEWQRLWAESQ